MARRRKKYLSQKRGTNRKTAEQKTPLFSQIGKQVKINRGGPNSKEGILLNAKRDYAALLVDQEVIYFTIKHIHSVTENIKESSSELIEKIDDQLEFLDYESLTGVLSKLKNKKIQINNGPESRVGELLGHNSSMIAILHEEDGIVFYNMEHVKLIKASSNSEGQERMESTQIDQFNYDYLGLGTFSDLMDKFKHQWVSVNRTGPEALEGVLLDEGRGFYTIVNNEEAFRIHPFHIKSISVGAKGSFKGAKENEEKEKNEIQEVDESSYTESCACEDSVLYEEFEEKVKWNPEHHIKTYDVFN